MWDLLFSALSKRQENRTQSWRISAATSSLDTALANTSSGTSRWRWSSGSKRRYVNTPETRAVQARPRPGPAEREAAFTGRERLSTRQPCCTVEMQQEGAASSAHAQDLFSTHECQTENSCFLQRRLIRHTICRSGYAALPVNVSVEIREAAQMTSEPMA